MALEDSKGSLLRREAGCEENRVCQRLCWIYCWEKDRGGTVCYSPDCLI